MYFDLMISVHSLLYITLYLCTLQFCPGLILKDSEYVYKVSYSQNHLRVGDSFNWTPAFVIFPLDSLLDFLLVFS